MEATDDGLFMEAYHLLVLSERSRRERRREGYAARRRYLRSLLIERIISGKPIR